MFDVAYIGVGDASAASEAEIDKWVKLFVNMEDPDIVIDLRELLRGGPRSLSHSGMSVQSEVGLAVLVLHMLFQFGTSKSK